MALAFRSGSFVSAGNASGGDLTLNKPTGTADGDIVVVVVYFEPDTTTISISPGTWETVETANTGAFKLKAYVKRASSEPTSYTISNSTSGNQWRAAAGAAYSGGTGTGTIIDVSSTAQADGQNAANQTVPAVTTAGADRMIVFCYGNFSGTNVSSMAGFTTNLRGSFGGVTIADALKATAGATTTSRPNAGPGTEDYAAIHLALISDTGGGSTQTIGMNAIASGLTLYQPTVTPGSVTVATNAIAAGSALYQPAVIGPEQDVATNAIASAATLYQPTVTPPAQALATNAIASTAALFDPTVTPGSVTVSTNAIGATTTLYEPTVLQDAQQVEMNAISSTAALYQPTITPGQVTVALNQIASTLALYQPTITTLTTIAMNTITGAVSVYQPAVAPGTVTISAEAIASALQLFSPTVTGGEVQTTYQVAVAGSVFDINVVGAVVAISVAGAVPSLSAIGAVTDINAAGAVPSFSASGSTT